MRPAGISYPKNDNRKIKPKYICTCNPNNIFKGNGGKCPVCGKLCVTAEAFMVDQTLKNSPKIMKSSDKKQDKRKSVKIEKDFS